MPPFAIFELGQAIARIPATCTQITGPPAIVTDDDLLANLLISTWALASGRFLRRGVRPEQLTKEELINFWADDMTVPSGRHAAPTGQQQPGDSPQLEIGSTLAVDQ